MSARAWAADGRWSVSAVFFVNGAAFANWVTRIPQVQHRLGLGDAALGLALFGVAAGALVAMPLTGGLVSRRGSGPVTRWLALAFCACLPLPAIAPSFAWLVLALVALGAANGGMDVAMNAQAAAVERARGEPIMASFHALYSTGGLLGALSGAAFAGRGMPPPAHLAIVALTLGLVALAAGPGFLPGRADARAEVSPSFTRPDRSLLALAALAFCVLLCEGAIADWSAVYMVKMTGASAATAAAAFAAFSLAMAAGRFAGDALTRRFGPVRLVRAGGFLAAAGLGVGLATAHPFASVAGFGCVGAGFSCVFPCIVRAAARSRTLAAGAAIAAVSTVGYGGFLAGPPIIGAVGEAFTLRAGLGLVVALCLAVAALAPQVDASPAPRGAPSTAKR